MTPRPVSALRPVALGAVTLILLMTLAVFWGLRVQIAGAVIASGVVRAGVPPLAIQHPEGGVVRDIAVRDGDLVAAGALLLRLDDTALQSERALIDAEINEIAARMARLRAERDGADHIVFAPPLDQAAKRDPAIAALIAGQERLFLSRRARWQSERALLDERRDQLANQISGIEAEQNATRTRTDLARAALADDLVLQRKGLVGTARIRTQEREVALLMGQDGRLAAEISAIRDEMASVAIRRLQIGQNRREEAITLLRDFEFRAAELTQTRRALSERIRRLDIRAPLAGRIHALSLSGPGAVAEPAARLMSIIAGDRPPVVVARIDANSIDDVATGQMATLKFTGLDPRRMPDISGRVTRLSADVFTDEATGSRFYRAEITPDAAELDRMIAQPLLPGMPVEVFLTTASRTPLAYLTAPLTTYFSRALRDG